MNEEINEELNTFSEVEILIGSCFALTVDAICFFIDWTGVGLAIAPFLQSGAMFILTMWSWSKGDTASLRTGRQIAKHLSNWLPLIPTVLAVFLIEVYLHNHPKAAGSVTKALGSKTIKSPKKI